MLSPIEIKEILTTIIRSEDKRDPLSDAQLQNLIQDQGHIVPKRHIVKYREQLNIPVARFRKEL